MDVYRFSFLNFLILLQSLTDFAILAPESFQIYALRLCRVWVKFQAEIIAKFNPALSIKLDQMRFLRLEIKYAYRALKASNFILAHPNPSPRLGSFLAVRLVYKFLALSFAPLRRIPRHNRLAPRKSARRVSAKAS